MPLQKNNMIIINFTVVPNPSPTDLEVIINNYHHPKRQRQQLDSKIDAIKRKLAKKSG